MEIQSCGRCGSSKIYLKRKGASQIGAYCCDCNSWLKWVGKKDLTFLKSKGLVVQQESFMYGVSEAQGSFGVGLSVEASESPNKGVGGASPYVINQEIARSYVEGVCPVCATGNIEAMTKNGVDGTMFENVFTLTTNDRNKILYTAKFKYCPECGKKYTK